MKRMKIFVYGTLKKERKNHCFLEAIQAKFVRTAKTQPKFWLIVNIHTGIPYLVKNGNTGIQGEVYEIEEGFLAALDAFESYYVREEIFLSDGEKVWCYIAPLKILSDGTY